MEIQKEKKSKTKKRKVSYDDEYEVEKIVEHNEVSPQIYIYFIKWKGWATCHNTWEPLQNLNCDNKLQEYLETLTKKDIDPKKINEIKMTMMNLEDNHIDVLLQQHMDNGKIKIPDINRSLLKTILEYFASLEEEKWDLALKEKLKNLIDLEILCDLRTTQLESLTLWQKKINETDTSKVPLTIENYVDLEGAPPKFTYITEYQAGEGIYIPSDPLVGCDCGERCRGGIRCCANSANSVHAYFNRKIRVEPGVPIYECNKRCSCNQACANRVIQHGRLKRLCIFRTSNSCGWGLKTREKIAKGTFITQYVGEVITNEEAEKRGLSYDADGRTYLFDLDFNGKENPYTVDATVFGNESHFINHSCDPNTAIYAAFVNCLDPNLPLLAIFAIRDINAGEEITFNYSSQRKDNNESVPGEDEEERRVFENYLCKCGSDNCRQYLFK